MASKQALAVTIPIAEETKADARTSTLGDRIAQRAYFKAQARGFDPGHELDDWLEAEKEITESVSPIKKH